MRLRRVFPLSLVALSFSLTAVAKKPEQKKDDAKPAAAENGPRKDPKGITGISPFWEAVKKGDDAFAARDLDGAKAAYQDAIRSKPQNPMGHYRMGEVELAKGNLKDAEGVWQTALRFAGEDPTLKGKILFVLADVKERQRSLEDATTSWNGYAGFAKSSAKATMYPNTAADRIKRIEDWKKLEADYGPVKDRIKQRLEEAEKKAAESAQSPRNK